MNENKVEHSKNSVNTYVNYPKSYIITFIIGLLILIPAAIIGDMHKLTGFQEHLFYDFNNLSNSIKQPVILVTDVLGAYVGIALCVIIPLLFKRFRLAWRFFFTVGGAGAVTEGIKAIIREPRPYIMLHGHLHLRVPETGYNSFPSAHVTVATAMALTVFMLLPKKWRWISVVWILLVAFSRLYLGAHAPIDLVGALGVGMMAVSFVRLLPYAIAKPLHLDTKIPLLYKGW